MSDEFKLSEATRSVDLVGKGKKAKALRFFPIKVAPVIAPDQPLSKDADRIGGARLPLAWGPLPAVLAGPIVRRAEDSCVYVWICTAIPASVDAFIFDVSDFDSSKDTALGVAKNVETRPFGSQLHAALVPIKPVAGPFPRDTILFYQMRLTAREGVYLGDVCFHKEDLAYGQANYPSFVLPSDATPSVLIQGSCRKLHGGGKDAITHADAHVRGVAAIAELRPQQMLFTGDQIYADDVDGNVLRLAQKLGPALLGFDEMIPLDEPKMASEIPGGGKLGQRGKLVLDAGFTNEPAACVNHLMAFSEFVVMYLLLWSGQMWDYAQSVYPKLYGGSLEGSHDPKAMQRLLANVPTYMMCDDHEVTDDWFIDSTFAEKATTNPLLRRILFNALSTYWLFQAWGNDPTRFAKVGDVVERRFATHPRPDPASEQILTGLYDVTGTFTASTPRLAWSFRTPPPAAVIMMDTRTRRDLRKHPDGAALLNDDALRELGEWLSGATPADQPVIVVSPPTVFGHDVIEWIQGALVWANSSEFYTRDFESWAASGEGLRKFLRTIAQSGRRRIIFFAGDVHYAFANSVAYCFFDLPSVEVLHLTSSALKNKPDDGDQRKLGIVNAMPGWCIDAHTFGVVDGDSYSRSKDSLGEFANLANEAMAGAVGPSHSLYMNWHFHALDGGPIVKDNNVGTFTIERGKADPWVCSDYIDESENHHRVAGTWKEVMASVQPRLATQPRWKP